MNYYVFFVSIHWDMIEFFLWKLSCWTLQKNTLDWPILIDKEEKNVFFFRRRLLCPEEDKLEIYLINTSLGPSSLQLYTFTDTVVWIIWIPFGNSHRAAASILPLYLCTKIQQSFREISTHASKLVNKVDYISDFIFKEHFNFQHLSLQISKLCILF